MNSKANLKTILTPEQYRVTQEDGTETPFTSDLYYNNKDGIYVDVVDGTPLFSSSDKFESGSGWPSFTKPIDKTFIQENFDSKLGLRRTEIRSNNANSHLGHVFEDGPEDTGGLRYCINGSALRFISKEDLKEEGYNEYLSLFN